MANLMFHDHRDMSPGLGFDNLDIRLLEHLFVVHANSNIYINIVNLNFNIIAYFFPRSCSLHLRLDLNFDSIMTFNLTFVTTTHLNIANLLTNWARTKVTAVIFPFLVVTIRRLWTQLFAFRWPNRLFTSTRYKNFGRTTIARNLK